MWADCGLEGTMPKIAAELGDKKVASLAKQEGRHAVGGCRGLQLRVTNTGSASWLLRIKLRTGRRVDIGIGSYDEVSLEEARERGRQLRRQVREGTYIDAGSTRQKATAQAKLEAEQAKVTFGQDAVKHHETKAQEFRNPKHADQWIQSLRTYAAKLWDRPSSEITRDEVLDVLKPQWTTKTETMTRVRQRIEAVFGGQALLNALVCHACAAASARNLSRSLRSLSHCLFLSGSLATRSSISSCCAIHSLTALAADPLQRAVRIDRERVF
jgi:hypothetical protein